MPAGQADWNAGRVDRETERPQAAGSVRPLRAPHAPGRDQATPVVRSNVGPGPHWNDKPRIFSALRTGPEKRGSATDVFSCGQEDKSHPARAGINRSSASTWYPRDLPRRNGDRPKQRKNLVGKVMAAPRGRGGVLSFPRGWHPQWQWPPLPGFRVCCLADPLRGLVCGRGGGADTVESPPGCTDFRSPGPLVPLGALPCLPLFPRGLCTTSSWPGRIAASVVRMLSTSGRRSTIRFDGARMISIRSPRPLGFCWCARPRSMLSSASKCSLAC